jgi:opacity protein-like surface antigen
MKKILLSLTAVAALAAAAAPAAAQTWRGQDGYDQRGYDQRGYDHQRGYGGAHLTTGYVDGLQWKIRKAANEGRISRGEARGLMAEFRQVQPLAWRVQNGQASGWERQRLERTVNRIEQAVSGYARNDRPDRDYGYGYGDQRRR